MRSGRRIEAMFGAMILALAVSCTSDPTVEREPVASQPASQPADTKTDGSAIAVSLRTAMMPGEEAQPFHIHIEEWRKTSGADVPTTVHELQLDIHGKLTGRTPHARRNDPDGTLVFERIRIRFRAPDLTTTNPSEATSPGDVLTYDSAKDKPGTGNLLADLMTHVIGAKLTLRITPNVRLRKLDGLDAIWSKANLLMAPPRLFPIQWQFRDASMSELIAESLFPPMPFSPVRVGDRWETEIEANIPLVSRLNSHLRVQLVELSPGPDGLPMAQTESTGEIVNAPDILPGNPPTLRTTVKSATHNISQRIDWRKHTLDQTSRREMELEVTLKPPSGEGERQIEIHQKRTLISKRDEGTKSEKVGKK